LFSDDEVFVNDRVKKPLNKRKREKQAKDPKEKRKKTLLMGRLFLRMTKVEGRDSIEGLSGAGTGIDENE
jgi:hypothetical protein